MQTTYFSILAKKQLSLIFMFLAASMLCANAFSTSIQMDVQALRQSPRIRIKALESEGKIDFTMVLLKTETTNSYEQGRLELVDRSGAVAGTVILRGEDVRHAINIETARVWKWEALRNQPAEVFKFTVNSNLLPKSRLWWWSGPLTDERGIYSGGADEWCYLQALFDAAEKVEVTNSTSRAQVARSTDVNEQFYKEILERKYGASLQRFEVVSFSPTTKVLWFDWQRNWWGTLNVIETTNNGAPLYWYDIEDPPVAQSIESVRVVTLSGQKYLEVIDCTHMGNGMLYLYEIRDGRLRRKLRVRVIANLSVAFEPRISRISYRDLDQDGDDDVLVDAVCVETRASGSLGGKVYTDHREFVFDAGDFRERKENRVGKDELME